MGGHFVKIFDCHCHLQDERLHDGLENHLKEARKVGVSRFASCGVSEEDWPILSRLADENNDIIPSFGLHPWEVSKRSQTWSSTLRRILESRPSGVGEIGLDHGIKERNDKEQEEVFLTQVELAVEFNRPISIHCRRAFPTLIRLLKEVELPKAGFVVHSYSGKAEDIDILAALGGYFSFSGTCTFTRNKKAHRNIKAVPKGRLLVETDAPDMYPLVRGEEPLQRGEKRTNFPANIIHPINTMAALLEMDIDELTHVVWANANRLFASILERDNEKI